MLSIVIPAMEYYDERKNEFISTKSCALQLEHSLVSLQKWESKWHKPFLSKEQKSLEETLDYVRCMTITQNVNDEVYGRITPSILKQINEYIDNPMTATTINQQNQKPSREIVTAEIIYYWMVDYDIPYECRKWHLNQLLTLIQVCGIKNTPAKKMSKKEAALSNAALNKARRAATGSKG